MLAATTVSAGATAAAYAAQGVTNLQACAALASTGVFTAALGSVLTRHVQPGPLKRITGVALICIAPVIFMGARSRQQGGGEPGQSAGRPRRGGGSRQQGWRELAPYAAAGSAAGLSQGFVGIGGGLIMTTLMTVGTDLDQHTIIATALSATTLINTSATVFHFRMGHVHVRAAALLSGVAACTAVGASYLALRIDEAKLRQFLSVAVLASSVPMLR